ncbi:hypothetical protein D9758_001905 [Tetrapyrgos nigripes]|uniref:Zn(2)-C6 fungal-type domain-containing protein n=1 Tax=Tetrapyrgos nigripes TaxID=182062 RepID=A0A8H5GTA9_9AGAR|nr:hypothetical protein D9758_001905 [Tetrapyrgos nigripes]
MSSDEQDVPSSIPQGWKKRRLQGACDTCRRKALKCDSANMPGNRCSNCIAFSLECTHSEPPKKRGPKSAYVDNLEKRVKELEETLRKVSAGGNLQDLTSKDAPNNTPSPPSLSNISGGSPLPIHPPSADSPSSTAVTHDDEDLAHIALAEHLKLLSLDAVDKRFFGDSSGFMLMKSAHVVKSEFTGVDSFNSRHFKRPKFWTAQHWEIPQQHTPTYTFPENDLLVHLISLYFEKVNAFLPVLHAPTFKRNITQGLHLRNHQFGATVLLVCALASRYSEDPRVLAISGEELSAGWQWYRQVEVIRQSLFEIPTLFELQVYCLATLYLIGSSCPQASWTLVSIGIRFAQELGVHRRKPDGYKWTTEAELKKRAFWVLVSLDRLISCFVGRPSSIRDEDFDVEPPIEVDDEFWENPDPTLAFQQPPDKPSVVSCFIWHLKLCEILAFTLRTLYSTKKSKILLGLVGDWEAATVAELDSSLNSWVNSIPEHLRWDPNRTDKLFFQQSAFLYIQYYHCQIQTHRPFLQRKSSISFPSLAICTNSARACIHVAEVHAQRGIVGLPYVLNACFTAAVVLLFNIWGSKRAGIRIDPQRELWDVQKMIGIFNACDRWTVAGRFCDILAELARDLNPADLVAPTKKRSRDSDTPMCTSSGASGQHSTQSPFTEQLHNGIPSETPNMPFVSHSHTTSPYGQPAELQRSFNPNTAPVNVGHTQTAPPMDQYNKNYKVSVPVSSNMPDYVGTYIPQPSSLSNQIDHTVFDSLFADSHAYLPKAPHENMGSFQVGPHVQNQHIHNAALAEALDLNANLWMSAPTSFNFDDWGRYVERERDMFSSDGQGQSSDSSPGVYPDSQRV